MPREPLVSVCLPTYNGESFVADAIDSVLKQTYRHFELIVIDDGSSDRTTDIVTRMAKTDQRIKFYKNPKNLGLFENYNECMRRAAGTYIKLFAQDDIFQPTILEQMVSVLESDKNIALVTCAKEWLDGDGKLVAPVTPNEKKITRRFETDMRLEGRFVMRESLRDLVNWLGEPCTIMFRKKDAGTGFDTRFKQIGDLDFAYRLLRNGDYYFLTEALCQFRKHTGSTTRKNDKDLIALLDWLVLGNKYRDLIPEFGETEDQFCARFTRRFMHAIASKYFAVPVGQPTGSDASGLEHLMDAESMLSAFECAEDKPRNSPAEFRAFAVSCLREGGRMHNEHKYLKHVVRIQRETILSERIANGEQIEALNEEVAELKLALSELGNSLSWKVTAPLRNAKRLMK
jgi:glycosyltransferase involved in cell wall biosynthesis